RDIVISNYYKKVLPEVLTNLQINGNSEVLLENGKFFVDSQMRISDVGRLTFESRVMSDFQYDVKDKRGELSAFTKSSLINNRNFYAEIEAASYEDSIVVRNLGINNELIASGWIKLSPKPVYGFKISGEDIDIKELMKYKMTNYQANQYTGLLDLNIDFNSNSDSLVNGKINVNNFSYDILKEFSTEVVLNGNLERVNIVNTITNPLLQNKLILDGYLSLKDKVDLDVGGSFTDLELSNIFTKVLKGKVSGKVNARFLQANKDIPILHATLSSSGLSAGTFSLSRVIAEVKQYPDSLVVEELNLYSKDQVDLNVSGALGYNILNGQTILNGKSISLTMSSDLAKVLKNLNLVDKGKLPANLSAEIVMMEDGISIQEGGLTIKGGNLFVKTQLEELNGFNIDFSVNHNVLSMNRFEMKVGRGKLYIRNEIENTEKDLMLGLLRIGKLYIRTGSDGIDVTVPQYSQENTLTNAIIKGRNRKEAIVEGPFDDLYIESDVILRNALALYPPEVDNLLKLFGQLNPLGRKKSVVEEFPLLPFRMDTIIYFDENSRYITYPANIPVKENSFIHLLYNGEEWIVKQLLINADSGTFAFFGINFKVDYFEVGINQYSGEYLLGELYHKTADGTTIFLTIDTNDDTTKSFGDRLTFKITSDNPNDSSTMSILARLRYESDLADLSADQQSAIWKDEALKMLEGNLNSYYLNPILYPVENNIRKMLKLDFLYIDFGFLQNVYSNYVINQSDAIKREESQIVEFSSSILLDNLKINAGKYLTRNIYLDYTALFQETTDLEKKTKMIVDHNATFRVSLPYRFKISYSFALKPDDPEMYSHEVMLQRSFRFDFNNYKYNKKPRRHYAIQSLN
ncbi:MAG: hypothetical protein JXR56_07275, partial [Candidatus Cloacimonetes bacterium]|nr:hypothetical protein [Candidatus Cloacimonadota bacterium]